MKKLFVNLLCVSAFLAFCLLAAVSCHDNVVAPFDPNYVDSTGTTDVSGYGQTDKKCRLTMQTVSEQIFKRYKYDSRGRVISEIQTRLLGAVSDTIQKIEYQYNNDNSRVTYKVHNNEVPEAGLNIVATLDAYGRVMHEDNGNNFTYDNRGHLIKIENPEESKVISFTWTDDDVTSYTVTIGSYTSVTNFAYYNIADKRGFCPAREFNFSKFGADALFGKPNKHVLKNEISDPATDIALQYYFNSRGFVTKVKPVYSGLYIRYEYDCN
ncbi:MAG: DUF4595 domain-containing protein [Bacteroidota bacterium]